MKRTELPHRPSAGTGEDGGEELDSLLVSAFEAMPRGGGRTLRGEEIRRMSAESAAAVERVGRPPVASRLLQWLRRPAGSAALGFASGAVVLLATLLFVAPDDEPAPRRVRLARTDPMTVMIVEFDPLRSMLGTFEHVAPGGRDTR